MDSDEPTFYSIGELADKMGVSRRTVRFYVQRELIDPPIGRGRGSGYTEKHVTQIQRVLNLQREGLPLENIGQLADGAVPEAPARVMARPQVVVRLTIAPGVRLEIDAGTGVPSPEILDALAKACTSILFEVDE
jgi:DNA-binding transcriptional MerR regulator